MGEYCLFSYDFGRSTEETSTASCNQPTKVREVALLLRSNIMAAAKTQLLENLTLKYILKGEVRVPSNVSFFKIFHNWTRF